MCNHKPYSRHVPFVQVWYLQGWTLHLAGDASCVESLARAKRLYHANACDRPEVLEHIEELLAEHQLGGREADANDNAEDDGDDAAAAAMEDG